MTEEDKPTPPPPPPPPPANDGWIPINDGFKNIPPETGSDEK